MSLWLTKEELFIRTKYRQNQRICAELARQGVEFKVRHDGFPLVDRAQFEGASVKPVRRKEPNYAALDRRTQ